MAATMATTTMALLNTKCINHKNTTNPSKPKPISLLSVQKLATSRPTQQNMLTPTSTAIAGAIFTTLTSCDPAFAAQQLAEIAEGDNRGLALLLPIIPAIIWVLFNILQPAINQLNRMKETKGVIVGIGLGGLAASGLVATTPDASAATESIGMIAEAATDNRGQLLLFVVAPAILWVLYNILQPALNQLNRMRSE